MDIAFTDSEAARRRRAARTLLAASERALRRTARRYSLCADDADDALQRALEILLTKAPPIEGPRLAAWMQTVTRREALAVRRSRERLLGSRRVASPGALVGATTSLDLDPIPCPGPEERFERRQRLMYAAELLAALKPDERRAIVLQAEGYSYAEIQGLMDWTYTKVNRCLAEGRARLRALARAGR